MKSITILGEVYKIKLIKGLMESEGVEGYVEPHDYEICIDAGLARNKRVFLRTFYHEVGHAFAFESGLHEFLSGQALEMFCQSFSKVMCDLKKR